PCGSDTRHSSQRDSTGSDTIAARRPQPDAGDHHIARQKPILEEAQCIDGLSHLRKQNQESERKKDRTTQEPQRKKIASHSLPRQSETRIPHCKLQRRVSSLP